MSMVWTRGEESHRGADNQGGNKQESDILTATQPDLTLSLNSASYQLHGLGGASGLHVLIFNMRGGEPGAEVGRVGLGELERAAPLKGQIPFGSIQWFPCAKLA